MINNNLKNMLTILNDYESKEDGSLINEISIMITKLLTNDSAVTIEDLDFIDEKIKYLDRMYDDLFELINLYDPVYSHFKNSIHKLYVETLRNNNKKKEVNK